MINLKHKKYDENLRFNLTEDMNNMMIELLITQQMLNECKLKRKYRKLLLNHKEEMLIKFRDEFRKHNVEEIKRYNEFMSK